MVKATYSEGDWFAVPLRNGGYAVGIVARLNVGGVLLGYFFGPRLKNVPTALDVAELTPAKAALIGKFGHLGLVQGRWPVLGRTPSWDRDRWVTPMFVRYEELTGRWIAVYYDDRDPNKIVRQEVVSAHVAKGKPTAGLMGPGYVESVLSTILGGVP
jgi:hypothetical protein